MMRHRIKYLILAALVTLSSLAASASEALYYVAPTKIPGVSRMMKTAGFWISLQPDPDRLIMDGRSIVDYNKRVQDELQLTTDLEQIPNPANGQELRAQLAARLEKIKNEKYFAADGAPAADTFFDEARKNMALEVIPDTVNLSYGFITRFSDQRLLPTDQGLYAKLNDIDFDELQNSDLDIGTPVIILHHSNDGRWSYVRTALSDGWVENENLARTSREDFLAHLAPRKSIVITDAKADLYLDKKLREFHDYARMGALFPAAKSKNKQAYAINLPVRSEKGSVSWSLAYIKKTQASDGFLPYTPRTVIEQAFKLLNAPYGWGGMNGEQDCSRFLQEIFATAGVFLPRNSKEQAKAGRSLAGFDESSTVEQKIDALKNVAGSGVILPLKGHIMLYLGMVEGRPYAIHAVWGFRQPGERDEDVVRVINRVAVSDLFLGEGSKKGSLLQRMTGIEEVKN